MANHRSLIIFAVFATLSALAFGCASNVPMARVSSRVMQSVEASYSVVMQGPFLFKTRKNVCECDRMLVYEAEIFGVFRHIKVDREIPGLETGSREVCFGQTGQFYESSPGQLFYEFEVLSDDSCLR